jgi:hypothetical protein
MFDWLLGKPTPPPNVSVSLTCGKTEYSVGEQIKGNVTITSQDDLVVERAVVYLSCLEKAKKQQVLSNQYGSVQREYWDSATIYSTYFQVFGKARIPVGFKATYPYCLNIPLQRKRLITALTTMPIGI